MVSGRTKLLVVQLIRHLSRHAQIPVGEEIKHGRSR
jgi:hypothetical protein